MSEGPNLLVPPVYDLVWSGAALLGLGALVAALIVWVRHHGTGLGAVAELALILLVPVIGPLAYLVGRFTRDSGRAARPPAAQTRGPSETQSVRR